MFNLTISELVYDYEKLLQNFWNQIVVDVIYLQWKSTLKSKPLGQGVDLIIEICYI